MVLLKQEINNAKQLIDFNFLIMIGRENMREEEREGEKERKKEKERERKRGRQGERSSHLISEGTACSFEF